jgi:hypothetical protein
VERPTLDLRFSVYAGTKRNGAIPVLYTQLRSPGEDQPGHPSELVVLCRDESGLPPPWITTSAVEDHQVLRLETLVLEAGFPARTPRIVANRGKRGGMWEYTELDVQLLGRSASWFFFWEGAGFSGDDAGALRELLELLGNMAEAGGRPAVSTFVNRFIHDPSRMGVAMN